MSAAAYIACNLRNASRARGAALALAAPAFALMWAGGVASHWLGWAEARDGRLASLFLALAGLVVLLGARGRGAAASLGWVALLGFAVELAGSRLGVPFGGYSYTAVLQPQLLGVPVVMGFAWMALVAFACDAAGRLRLGVWATAAAGALLTTAADLVIDPLAANQFGYWSWEGGGAYYGVPFSNFVGWFVTAFAACRILAPRQRANPWAGFVGGAVLLFFALTALAHTLLPVALLGFGLCGARLLAAATAGGSSPTPARAREGR
ncbi:MAG TPA: carotenoid biosynthesis protein [Pyrinomonadaceae bacterium]